MPMDDIPACQAYSPEVHNAFGYQPSLATAIVFLALFFLSSCIHLFQAVRYRALWQGLCVIGAGAECLGWIARKAAWKCSYSTELFTMQIVVFIFAPAWTMAGIYMVLFRMISILAKRTSPFPAKACLWTCQSVDFISLVLQATGGGLAGKSFSSNVDTRLGTYTMVAGIIFQLISTVTYAILMSIVFVRGFQGIRSSRLISRLASVLVLATAGMIARDIYHNIELLQGWTRYLNTYEAYVIGLNGVLMVTAVLALNVCNSGKLLAQAVAKKGAKRSLKESDSEEEVKRSSSEASVLV